MQLELYLGSSEIYVDWNPSIRRIVTDTMPILGSSTLNGYVS